MILSTTRYISCWIILTSSADTNGHYICAITPIDTKCFIGEDCSIYMVANAQGCAVNGSIISSVMQQTRQDIGFI